MIVNPFASSGALTAFNANPAQNAPQSAPTKVQAYQPQTRQAVEAPRDNSESETRSSYNQRGQLFADQRGSNIDLLV